MSNNALLEAANDLSVQEMEFKLKIYAELFQVQSDSLRKDLIDISSLCQPESSSLCQPERLDYLMRIWVKKNVQE